jgi:hypothetical protein
MSTTNRKEFWDKINKLGPRSNITFPEEIVDCNGNVICEERFVLEKWRKDFENLYNCADSTDFNSEHFERAKVHKLLLENNMDDPLYTPNESLNKNINIEEICLVVEQAKSTSAVGIDNISYGALKSPPVITVLHELFQLIFDSSLIPSTWRKAIICPIHKDPASDPRVPMNYRGVSLLSCTSKLYSAFMNKRLTNY